MQIEDADGGKSTEALTSF